LISNEGFNSGIEFRIKRRNISNMIRNYVLIAVRNLKNSILFSFLNVIGLSIGIGCCLVIGLFLADQYSYDTRYKNANRIYRVVNKQAEGAKLNYVALTQGLLGPELLKTFPEIVAATRVGFTMTTIAVENKEPLAAKIMAVDTSFLSIFSMDFKIKPSDEIIPSSGILISEEASGILFGTREPIGEIISVKDLGDFKVAGVYKDFPYQSHLQADFIISFSWLEKTLTLFTIIF
jgi:putative ABC transport system permease protein